MRIRDIERAITSIQRAKERIEKMNQKYPKIYKNELEEIGKSVISEWYATYDPVFYDRQMSLKHAYKVDVNETEYNVVFDASLLSSFHQKLSEYIYENTFMQGYHGGAIKGKFHPSPGIPYWRTPFPELTNWGRPALRSFSPYYRMVNQMKKKIKEIDEQRQNEFDVIISRVNKAISKL